MPVPLRLSRPVLRPVATRRRSPAVPRDSGSVPVPPIHSMSVATRRTVLKRFGPPYQMLPTECSSAGRTRSGRMGRDVAEWPRDVLAVDEDIEQCVLGFAERREPHRARGSAQLADELRGLMNRHCDRAHAVLDAVEVAGGPGPPPITMARVVSSWPRWVRQMRPPTTQRRAKAQPSRGALSSRKVHSSTRSSAVAALTSFRSTGSPLIGGTRMTPPDGTPTTRAHAELIGR